MCYVVHPPLQYHAECQATKSQLEDNFETRHFSLLLSSKPHHGHVVPYLVSANFRLMHDKIQKAVSTWCFWLLPKYLEIPHFNLSLNPKGFCFTCHSFSWMFCLLSVSWLSVVFCAHSCPCLGQTAVASVCCSLG